MFARPSVPGCLAGVRVGWGDAWTWVGGGITAYGAIYFGFHDVLVHQRISHRYLPRSPYMRRLVQAHRLHHAVETKHGTVSFGFLWAPPITALKARLAAGGRSGARAPAGSRALPCPQANPQAHAAPRPGPARPAERRVR